LSSRGPSTGRAFMGSRPCFPARRRRTVDGGSERRLPEVLCLTNTSADSTIRASKREYAMRRSPKPVRPPQILRGRFGICGHCQVGENSVDRAPRCCRSVRPGTRHHGDEFRVRARNLTMPLDHATARREQVERRKSVPGAASQKICEFRTGSHGRPSAPRTMHRVPDRRGRRTRNTALTSTYRRLY
jgi:hypothetical protein